MNKYLNNGDPAGCCGCTACIHSCPTKCIEMSPNNEGFLYPKMIAPDKCINCGLCSKVCPMEQDNIFPYSGIYYAAYTSNKGAIENSSSGGLFPEIATNVLQGEGVVYGAFLPEDHQLIHIGISDFKHLYKIVGSKYIQSDLRDSFSRCKEDLQSGKKVLFTGTPCQIAGLNLYLRKDYENLYTADVICHGVPSQTAFNLYVDYLENKHKAKLVDINFRDKSRNGWSITLKYTMEYPNGKRKDFYLISKLSEYFMAFLTGQVLRESCYHCPFASMKRPGDITLGDFWGYQKTRPELKHNEGLSLLLVNSKKGEELVGILRERGTTLTPVNEENIKASENKNLDHPSKRPAHRDSVYNDLFEQGFDAVAQKYFRKTQTLKNKIKNYLPRRFFM